MLFWLISSVLAAPVADDIKGPLSPCSDDSIFKIDAITFAQYPFKKGTPISVKVSGELTEPIETGATVEIKVKLGFIPVYSKTTDFCEDVHRQGQGECPLAAGPATLSMSNDLPSNAPSGKYGLEVNYRTSDGRQIACLAGTIQITS